jgi:hypothetical protein
MHCSVIRFSGAEMSTKNVQMKNVQMKGFLATWAITCVTVFAILHAEIVPNAVTFASAETVGGSTPNCTHSERYHDQYCEKHPEAEGDCAERYSRYEYLTGNVKDEYFEMESGCLSNNCKSQMVPKPKSCAQVGMDPPIE